MAVLIGDCYRKGIRLPQLDDAVKPCKQLPALLIGKDPYLIKPFRMGSRAYSIGYDELLVIYIIIADCEMLHHGVKRVILLPEFCHG